ncbi:MAG: 3-phosphoshikimate 1-carboxyvinyltransferase [Bacteroides sp.]|nr:MAG: 3-phosphoshikimate 1-carboxyvinyltransferase [Bacteroides sp.]
MNVNIKYLKNINTQFNINLPGSKSESNRIAIIKNLCKNDFNIENMSSSHDTLIINKALKDINSNKSEINIESCGTAMRFLTSYCAITKGNWILKGDKRMHERPIKVLVNALINIGADINYIKNNGYPPLHIKGKCLNKSNTIYIDGSVSSQYISSILMIAPLLPNGLIINITGNIVSDPYIKMTLNIMNHFGIKYKYINNNIIIDNQNYIPKNITVESDWSCASYWYSIAGLINSNNNVIKLNNLKKNSNQGDNYIRNIMNNFGITTEFDDRNAYIYKSINIHKKLNEIDLTKYPDIAQTIAVYLAGKGYNAKFIGLQSLKIKETDRISALSNELKKINILFESKKDNWTLFAKNKFHKINNICFDTYNDHRMALAFSAFSIVYGNINIKNRNVINKSYPNYWNDMENSGFIIK